MILFGFLGPFWMFSDAVSMCDMMFKRKACSRAGTGSCSASRGVLLGCVAGHFEGSVLDLAEPSWAPTRLSETQKVSANQKTLN